MMAYIHTVTSLIFAKSLDVTVISSYIDFKRAAWDNYTILYSHWCYTQRKSVIFSKHMIDFPQIKALKSTSVY